MGIQALGPKMCRRIAREIGQPIARAVGHGGYSFGFVTFDHEHGVWSKKDGSWAMETGHIIHWSSCSWLFVKRPADVARSEMASHLAVVFEVPKALILPPMPDNLCGSRTTLHALDLVCQQDITDAADSESAHPGKPHWCGSEQWVLDDDGHPQDPRNIRTPTTERYT